MLDWQFVENDKKMSENKNCIKCNKELKKDLRVPICDACWDKLGKIEQAVYGKR